MDFGDFMFFFAELHVEKIQYGGRTEMCDFFKNEVNGKEFW